MVYLWLWIAMVWAGDTYNVGSAKKLEGTVGLTLVFVSDATSDWTAAERREMRQKLRTGERWLEAYAREYSIPLNFRNKVILGGRNLKLARLPAGIRSGHEDVTLVSTLAQTLGKDLPQAFLRTRPDQQAVLIFLKRDGASYAIPQEQGLDSQYDVEGIVLYQAFDSTTPNCASCIAHEILHIFGAWDLYATFQTTMEQEEQAKRMYPNSIMLRTSYDIEELTIDPITCWRIGWCTQPDQAYFFQPQP